MFSKSDEQLIAKAIAGNKKAWFGLISRHEKAIYSYGIRMTGSSDDAKDLMQEIFVSVYRNLSSYKGTGSFKAWLFRIAHYRCIEFYRRKKPNISLDDAAEPDLGVNSVSPEVEMQCQQVQSGLVRAMQTLPMNQRAVIELKFFGQFTFDEIADQLGISANTVKSRLYTALGKLKIVLEVEYV